MSTTTPPPPSEKVCRGLREYRAVALIMVNLYRHGFARGRDEGSDQPNPVTITELEQYAASAVRAAAPVPYQPNKNPADAILEDEYRETKNNRHAAEERLRHQHARLREEQLGATAHGNEEAPPELPPFLVGAATAAVGFSVALTVYAAVFRKMLHSTSKAVVLSSLTGLVIALPLITTTVSSVRWPVTPRRLAMIRFGVALAFAVGLMLARGVDVVSVGLMLVEIAVLAALELFVVGERERQKLHEERKQKLAIARARTAAAEEALTETENTIANYEQRERQHHASIEEREFMVRSLDAVVEAAKHAQTLGYSHGVTARKSYLTGAADCLPTDEEIIALLS